MKGPDLGGYLGQSYFTNQDTFDHTLTAVELISLIRTVFDHILYSHTCITAVELISVRLRRRGRSMGLSVNCMSSSLMRLMPFANHGVREMSVKIISKNMF